MPLCDVFHDFHGQLVLVDRQVGGSEDGRHLVLSGRNLVVLGLGEDSQLPQLLIKLLHVCRDAGLDGAKIVVFHLLALRGAGAKKGTAAEDQILALLPKRLVNQEIFLFWTDGGSDALCGGVAKKGQHTQRLLTDRLHRAEERGLLI